MDKRTLGKTGLQIAPLVLGGNVFGWTADEKTSFELLDGFVAAGLNAVDTADIYSAWAKGNQGGESETIIGKWFQRNPGNRAKVVLITKVGWEFSPERGGLSERWITQAIEDSLRRLQTDTIDLYQLHWPERNQPMFGQWQFEPANDRECTPIRDQLAALAELVQEGKVRAIGLSNEHPWGVMQFTRLADELGLPRVLCTQNAYSLLNRTFETALAEVCHREQVGLLAYSALAFGHLTGKYLADPAAPGRLTRWPSFGQRYSKPSVIPAVTAYAALAKRHGLSLAQLALGFARSRWFVSSTIIGASSLAQLKETLPATRTPISPELLAEIDAIHLQYTNPAP